MSAGQKRAAPLKDQTQNAEASTDASDMLSQDHNINDIVMVMHSLSIIGCWHCICRMFEKHACV